MAVVKIYKVTKAVSSLHNSGCRFYEQVGSLPELIQVYSYTLECGESYSYEKGNKKINRNPKSIKSLVTNLYNSCNNSAANGYSGASFSYEEI